ncbi:MAG: hypothetical protein M1817_004574 [Caeruleum heppii]|nr:MAG: hypothetical protein M1817_004574 [Caeruleum heppii]
MPTVALIQRAVLDTRAGPNHGVGSGEQGQEYLAAVASSNSESIRVGTLVLTWFNILAAVITIFTILYTSWRISGDAVQGWRKKGKKVWAAVHPAEVYPLIISVAIFLQGLVFASVEGAGVRKTFSFNCTNTSQVVWPAIWIVPFTTTVFAIEAMIRYQKRPNSPRRANWTISICVAVILTLLLLVWIPSMTSPAADICLGNLASHAGHHAKLAVMLFCGIVGLIIVSAFMISLQAPKMAKSDGQEQVAAQRMIFILPFFLQLTFDQLAAQSSVLASVMLNFSGIATCLLHFYLARPLSVTRRTLTLNVFRPHKGCKSMHITSPTEAHSTDHAWPSAIDKEVGMSIRSPLSPPLPPPTVSKSLHERSDSVKSTYKLFPHPKPTATATSVPRRPVGKPENPRTMRPTLTLNTDTTTPALEPPAPLFLRSHRRNESAATSATVQIGMRMSHAPPLSPPPYAPTFDRRLSPLTLCPPMDFGPLQGTTAQGVRSPHEGRQMPSPGRPRAETRGGRAASGAWI